MRRSDFQKIIKKYETQSSHYFENALRSIEAGNAEKASEFLWGSMAEALKAVAASRDNIRLRGHGDVKNYAMQLASALRDDNIRYTFDKAQTLHKNFYESWLELEDVARYAEDVKTTVATLLNLIPKKKQSHQEQANG